MRVCLAVALILAFSAFSHAQQAVSQWNHSSTPAVIPNRGMQSGLGKWMQIPDNPSIAIPVFTAEVWVQATSGGLIVTRDEPSGTPSDWQLWYDYSRYRLAFITARTPPDSYFFTPDNSFMPGQWYHVALVVNGPAGRAKLYIDGVLVISPTFSYRNFDCNTGLAWCGYFNNSSGAYLAGVIDEARYWNLERTQAQIIAAKDIDLPSNDRVGLVGWWRFCDSFEDYSGAGNHGTAFGNPQLVLISLPFGITCDDNPCDTVQVDIAGRPLFCEGDSTVLTASSGFRSYLWSTGDTTRSIVVRSTGRYRVDAVLSDSCSVAAEIDVLAVAPPVADAGADRTVCMGTVTEVGGMTHDSAWTYSWSPPTDVSHPDSAVTGVQTATSRSYVLTVTNEYGCSASDTVRVNVVSGLPLALPDSVSICPGTQVVLPLDVLGGVPPFRFEWSPSDELSAVDVQNPIASPSKSRWYRVRVTDFLGCFEIDSILVSTMDGLEILLPDSILMCEGGARTLPLLIRNGSAPYSYRWLPSEGLDRDDVAQPVATPDTTRWYYVTVRDSLGCTGTDSVLVRVVDGLATSLPDSLFVCAGGATVLPLEVTGNTGGMTFRWTPVVDLNNPVVQRPVARPKSNITYHVHVTDSLGCEARDSVTVSLFPPADIAITIDGSARFCEGDSVRLVATPGYRSYRWYTPTRVISDTGNSIIARDGGSYRVAVVDSNGCETISQPVTISTFIAFEVPVTLNGTHPLCEGDSIMLEAGGGYHDYKWTNDSGRVLAFGRQLVVGRAGRYRVFARDSIGCIGGSKAMDITIEAKPVFSISGPRTVCIGSTHYYSTLHRSRWTYRWEADTGVARTVTDRESVRIEWDTAGRMSLSLLVRDNITGCTDSVRIEVMVITELKPVILASGPTILCDGDSVVLRSRDPHTISQWTDSSGTVLGTGRSITVRASGMLYYRAFTDDGCSGIDSMRVTVLAVPDPRIVGPAVVCIGDTATYRHAGGNGVLRWETSGGTLIDEDSARIVMHWDRPGLYRIIVWETEPSLRCTGADTLVVEVQGPPDASIGAFPDTVICETDSVRISAVPGYARYVWSTPDGTIDTTANAIIARRTGTYRVRVFSTGGCESESRAITITVHPVPYVRILGPASLCKGGVGVYSVGTGQNAILRWTTVGGIFESGTTATRVEIRWPAAGSVAVVVVADNGFCTTVDTLIVEVGDSVRPVVFEEGIPFCPGGEATLRADDGYETYTWQTPDGERGGQQIVVRRPGVYRVRVSTTSGCAGTSDSVMVVELPEPAPMISGPDALCPGDTVILQAPPGFVSYHWSDGSSGRFLPVHDAAFLTVTVVDSNGCTGTSPVHQVRLYPEPEVPSITREGMRLIATPAWSHQWYRSDSLLVNETSRECRITRDGEYRIVTRNEFGCESASAILLLDCISGHSVVSLPHLLVNPGDTVHINPRLVKRVCLEEVGARNFVAAIRYDKTVMVPLDGTPAGHIEGQDRVIPLAGTLQALLGQEIELRFLATLGLRDSVPLLLDAFEWLDSPVSAGRVHGSVRVAICREGGDRLFDAEGQIQLMQNRPNPFNTSTTINYELIERTRTEVYVLDMLGRRVRTLYSGNAEPGAYQLLFESGGLPSGQYIVVLRTPTAALHRVMLLLK